MEQTSYKIKMKCKTNAFPKWPITGERELELVEKVIKSGNLWRMTGNMVDDLEKIFAECHNAKHCLAVTNGTHAIELSLAALGITNEDEVLVSAFTFISTATAPIYCNAIPIPVDVDPKTFCMDPAALEKLITPRTKAIIPVHMAGHACDMDAICNIAQKYNIKVIEDCAHAHGAEWNNRKVGTFGDIGIFSFQNGKLVTSGEGGAIITNSTELYERAYLIHGVGRPVGDRIYQHLCLGSNYRMSEIQAAILIAQMERLGEQNEKREKNSRLLDSMLKDIPGIIPQGRDTRATLISHYMYMFYYDEKEFNSLSRQDFIDKLIERGIPAFRAFPAVCDVEFFKQNKFRGHIKKKIETEKFDLYNSRKIADEVVWLPHYTLLGNEDDIKEIAEVIISLKNN